MKDYTIITEFVLLGISGNRELQVVIFIFLFITFIVSNIGNLTIIILTLLNSHLKTPMYYFIHNFSCLKIMFTSVSIPRFLASIITQVKTISYNNCLAWLFFFIFMGVTEFFLLTAMSYDHYVAICKPLHYTLIMNQKACNLLVLTSWVAGFLTVFSSFMLVLKLNYCASNVINHFCCDYFPLLQLSCLDAWLLEVIGFYTALVILLFMLALVFSTCSSHKIVISVSYGSCIFIYVKPSANERASLTKTVDILSTSVAPMLNPFIHTLRNQQVKQVYKDLVHKVGFYRMK